MEQECDYAFMGTFSGLIGLNKENIKIIKPYSGAYIYNLYPLNTGTIHLETSISSPCSWIGFYEPANPENSFIRSSQDYFTESYRYTYRISLETGEGVELSGGARIKANICEFSRQITPEPSFWWREYEILTETTDLSGTHEFNCYVKLYS